LISLKT